MGRTPDAGHARRRAGALRAHRRRLAAARHHRAPGAAPCRRGSSRSSPSPSACATASSTPSRPWPTASRELDGHEVVALPLSPFSSRLTSGKYRRSALERRRRRDRNVPLLEGWYAEPRLRAGHQPARRGGARRLRRQRVGGALHRPQRAARDDHGGRPLRGPAAADHRAARPRARAGRLALRLPEQGPRRRRVDGARGRRRGARPGRGGLEEGARRAGGLRQRQRRDALRPRHRAARADRGPGHGVPPLGARPTTRRRSSRRSPTW